MDFLLRQKWQSLACACLVAGGIAAWARGPITLDDAFISYRYAEHLVHGHGIVFNPGEYVEGYTNFSWVLLSAAAIFLRGDPFLVTRWVGLLAYCACIVIALLTSFRIATQIRPSRSAGVFILVAVLVSSRGVARMAGAGLETFFVAACVLVAAVAFHFLNSSKRTEWLGAVAALIAVLTRMDAVLALVASFVATIASRRDEPLRRTLARRYGLSIAGLVAWTIWRLFYYESLLPNSFRAKGADGWHLRAGLYYLWGYARNSPDTVILGALAAFGLWAAWRSAWRGWQLFLCTFVLLHTAYVAKVGGDFMYYRFMFEALPFLLCAAAVGLILLPARSERAIAIAGLACVCVALSRTPPYLETTYTMQPLGEMNFYAEKGRQVGLALKEKLPADTVIATTLAGTIPYYSGLRTIDEWGLNDRFVAQMPGPFPFRRGHLKRAPIDYLEDQNVNLVIDHPEFCACDSLCPVSGPHVFIRMTGNQCLRTIYLVQRRELTRRFCENPGDFKLVNVPCSRTFLAP